MTLNAAVAVNFDNEAQTWSSGYAGNVQYLPQDRILGGLKGQGVKTRAKRNETIYNEGDAADHVYKIVSGWARVCTHLPDGRRQISDFLGPEEILGLSDLAERSQTVEAVTDVVLLAYPRSQIERAKRETPFLNQHILTLLTRKFADAQKHLVMLGRQTAKERLCSFLINLAEQARAEEGDEFALPMSRQDVADYLGLTIETVCRLLTELRQAGLVRLPNLHTMVLANTEGLEDVIAGDQ